MFKALFSSASSASSDSKALRELLEGMIKALVDEPSRIELTELESDPEHLTFELRVSKSDLGKVIGRNGRTASSMRTILSAAARKYKVNADLRIVE
jgi:predicted RNA-binding protein YlqC (UPF0109 family)